MKIAWTSDEMLHVNLVVCNDVTCQTTRQEENDKGVHQNHPVCANLQDIWDLLVSLGMQEGGI